MRNYRKISPGDVPEEVAGRPARQLCPCCQGDGFCPYCSYRGWILTDHGLRWMNLANEAREREGRAMP